MASTVYVINDINDVESDKLHKIKCERPIASGKISIKKAKVIATVLLMASIILNSIISSDNIYSFIILIIYIIINLIYTFWAKNIPILDIAILVSGFLLRVIYGALVIDVEISNWLYLTVMAISFYLALGKRRNELKKNGDSSRKVLKYYNYDFLDKNMYMSLCLAIVFYSLWCVDPITLMNHSSQFLIWTVPLMILICMKYSLDIESDSYGDPIDVILKDKTLIILVIIYILIDLSILYS